MVENIEKSLLEVDFASLTRRTFTPSPAAWEDQVLYFLLLDRFSDGNEKDSYRDNEDRLVRDGSMPLYRLEDSVRVDYDVWFRAGGSWQDGTLKGLRSKLGYLRRFGITALWVSPVFRRVAFEPSCHGYGILNFLEADQHFGTREEFRDLVKAVHEQEIYVILDIIAHRTGTVFKYTADRYTAHDPATGRWYNDPRWDGKPYTVQGFRDRTGQPTLPFTGKPDADSLEASWPDGASRGGAHVPKCWPNCNLVSND
jgi:glycosidase